MNQTIWKCRLKRRPSILAETGTNSSPIKQRKADTKPKIPNIHWSIIPPSPIHHNRHHLKPRFSSLQITHSFTYYSTSSAVKNPEKVIKTLIPKEAENTVQLKQTSQRDQQKVSRKYFFLLSWTFLENWEWHINHRDWRNCKFSFCGSFFFFWVKVQ